MKTIENSIILPIFTGICLALVALSCLACNTVLARSRAFVKVGEMQYGNLVSDTDEYARDALNQEIKKGSLGFDLEESSIRYKKAGLLTGGEVNLSIKGESEMKIPFLKKLEAFVYDKKFKLISPSYDLRKINSYIKGVKGIKDGLSGSKK